MKTALELIPEELQNVAMSDSDVARAVSIAKPANQKVREAAEARLRFEDEPATYLGFLNAQP
jgi:hypothetical protein